MTKVVKMRNTIPGDPSKSIYDLNFFLTDAQMQTEIEKCEYCEEKPCMTACPCDCSPADFIKAVTVGEPPDIMRSAALIMSKNPFGGICGQTCPEKHCMAACVHNKFDAPVKIPAVQATIIEKAKQLDVMPQMTAAEKNGKKVAIIGSGPAGLATAALLSQRGYSITLYEKEKNAGGMCNLIPDFRLDKTVLMSDIEWTLKLENIDFQPGIQIKDPEELVTNGFNAVVVAAGLWESVFPGIPNEERAIPGIPYLKNPEQYKLSGNIAIIGGGATAFDCGMTALLYGAEHVELFALEKLSEMPLDKREMDALIRSGIEVNTRIQINKIVCEGNDIKGISVNKVKLTNGKSFNINSIEPIPDSLMIRKDIHQVIIAIGAKPAFEATDHPAIFFAGDIIEGPSTVVEASAAGKNAGEQVDAYLKNKKIPQFKRNTNGCLKSTTLIPGYNFLPVDLTTDFFGHQLSSPFLLSAAPPTDGFDQMKRAYDAGWPGAIMKTSFDNVPIHIPAEYMFKFSDNTYANCDNVSAHQLDRVCEEVSQLITLYPDRMTMASTGGPVSGNDEMDRKGWQNNTLKLEQAGAMAIEYSLSCPQGGDGTEGDIVSQNATLSQKIISWILEIGNPDIPKIFKLTGAVTSIEAILLAIKDTFDQYPHKKAGVTLANTFPTMAFRKGNSNTWEEGIIVGMAGTGTLNISYLSLAKAAPIGVEISGNGGPMNYKEAANFLALGCKTVQFCSMPTKMGYSIIEELNSGLSHLMENRGIESVKELTGIALPEPIVDFMDLSPIKKISSSDYELCVRCGNCTRCPYLAITKDNDGYPLTDPAKCIGCKMCNYLCFTGAISMRKRTPEELKMLKEQ